MLSPLTKIVKRNTSFNDDLSAIQITFGTTEIEISLATETFWNALADIGGLLNLMLFFAAIAGCKHISQFNESLKKAYYRTSRAFMRQKLRLY